MPACKCLYHVYSMCYHLFLKWVRKSHNLSLKWTDVWKFNLAKMSNILGIPYHHLRVGLPVHRPNRDWLPLFSEKGKERDNFIFVTPMFADHKYIHVFVKYDCAGPIRACQWFAHSKVKFDVTRPRAVSGQSPDGNRLNKHCRPYPSWYITPAT